MGKKKKAEQEEEQEEQEEQEELQEILTKLKENDELYQGLLNELHLIDNRAENLKFWVIVSNSLQVFTAKDRAITEMQQVLVDDVDCSLAEISWEEKESKFDVSPVSQKEINVVLAKQVKELREKLEKKNEK